MKTIIKKLTIILFAAFLVLGGCSKDFLNTEPQGSIAFEQFYKTDDDATGAIMACYNMLQAINSTPWSSLWMMKTFASDEIYSGGAKLGDQPAADEINQFKYGSNNPIIKDVYSMSYFIIYRANLIIDNFQPDNDYKKAVIAEAKTLRAYTYLELVTLWGKVPLVLHALNPGEYEQPQASIEEIYAQIEKDLTEAIPDLPLKSNMAALKMDISRVSKGTAQAFLGKALLYEKKYTQAAAALQQVIDSHEYELLPDFSKILRKSSEFGIESVFEISFSEAKNNGWGTPNIWNNPVRTAMDNGIWELCGPRGDQGFDPGNSGLVGGWGFAYPTFSIYNAFKAAGDSVRLHASIMTESQLKALGGAYRNADGNYPWGCNGLVRLKYGTWASETTPVSVAQPELNYGTNIRVIRYADVLLMAAEAYNGASQDDKAYPLIKEVRDRVSLPDNYTGKTGADLLAVIKAERQLEFAFEGSRLQDLLRWGDAATVLADQGKKIPTGTITNGVLQYMDISGAGFKPRNVLFPFPFDEVTSNKKITQNQGY